MPWYGAPRYTLVHTTQNHKGQGLRGSLVTPQTSQNGWTSISMIKSGSGTHLGKKKIPSLGTGLVCLTGLALPYVTG